jgi:16S rRNA (adenine1518-N6/adenine1519-N6)-dimethyltransferase
VTITPATASDLLDRYGVAPKRSLGQNFVVDPNTVRRIARLADVGPRDRVIEIGAGLGSLTTALAETGARVLAIEIDDGLIPALKEVVAPYERVKVLHADVTKIDWSSQLDDDRRWVVVANLPYNLATPLVMGFLDEVPAVKRMLVMVQKEVGERFVAIPRTPAYGAVSVKVAYWAEAKIVGLVPPTVFMPKPKVDSALVSIVRRPKPAVPVNVDRDWLFQLVRTGFGQRRKMLRRSLAELVKPMSFERAGISPEARAEELDVYAWGLLASYSPRVAGGRPPARRARVPDTDGDHA